jgi:hypothetical protein
MNYNVLSMDGIEENFGEDGWDQTTLFPHGLCEAIFSAWLHMTVSFNSIILKKNMIISYETVLTRER